MKAYSTTMYLKSLKFSSTSQTIIPILVAVVIFMEFLDLTIINTAVPSIANDFNISPILLKFSVASYYLSLAIFIPISGWCADKFGTRKVFLFSVGLFVIASFLCGISHNSGQLTVFRFMQGIGGAFMNPVARIIILRIFPPKELIKIQGLIFTPAMLGFVLGPFLGGLITSYLSWHWIFYINIPVGILVIFFGKKYIKQYVSDDLKKFDILGFIIAGTGLFSITFFVEMLNHYEIVPRSIVFLSGLLGVSLIAILIIYCLNKSHPIFDFSLFRIKTFRIGFSIYLSTSAINASISFLLPLMFQENFHLNPIDSGMLVLPIAFGLLTFRGLASTIINRFGFKRSLNTALFLLVIAILLFTQIEKNTSIYYIIFAEFLFGAALVVSNSSTGALNYVDMPPDKTSVATSMDLTFRQFSSSFGIGLSAFFLTLLVKYFNIDLFSINADAFHYTFYFLASFAIIALYVARQLHHHDGLHALKSQKHKE